jgi:hypothetical protein
MCINAFIQIIAVHLGPLHGEFVDTLLPYYVL